MTLGRCAQPRLAGGLGRPQKRAAAPQKRAGGGRGRGRGRSGLGFASKRGRRELDLADMVAPALGGSGGPRFVERVQVNPGSHDVRMMPQAVGFPGPRLLQHVQMMCACAWSTSMYACG